MPKTTVKYPSNAGTDYADPDTKIETINYDAMSIWEKSLREVDQGSSVQESQPDYVSPNGQDEHAELLDLLLCSLRLVSMV